MKEMVLKRMGLAARNKKGFTLVEVIVVLVIIAILMAIAVPALTGYIDRAKDKALEAEGRNIQIALQAIATTEYGKTGTAVTWDGSTTTANTNISATTSTKIGDEVNKLVGKDIITTAAVAGADKSLIKIKYEDGKGVTGFVYQSGGKIVTYTAEGGLAVTTPTAIDDGDEE